MAILARPRFVPHLIAPAADAADAAADDQTRQTLTALYAEHGARIHRFLRDLLGDATLAADGTQETFVRAYKKLGSFEETAKITPWLFGIARNVSLELRKARMRAGRHLVAVSVDACDSSSGPHHQNGSLRAITAARSPESEYLGREALRIVGAALERLPEERRAMLLLRLDHGLSYDDIAVTMECSLAKVKVEIFRAREVLRATMREYESELDVTDDKKHKHKNENENGSKAR